MNQALRNLAASKQTQQQPASQEEYLAAMQRQAVTQANVESGMQMLTAQLAQQAQAHVAEATRLQAMVFALKAQEEQAAAAGTAGSHSTKVETVGSSGLPYVGGMIDKRGEPNIAG